MPRLKRSEEQNRYILMAGNIKKRMTFLNVSDKEMANLVGLSERRFAEKRRMPELFTYPELTKLVVRLKMSDSEILEGMR